MSAPDDCPRPRNHPAESKTPGRVRLEDGSSWPNATRDEDCGPEWRVLYAPESVTREDLMWLVSVSNAYHYLALEPSAGKRLPMLRRALRAQSDPKETR